MAGGMRAWERPRGAKFGYQKHYFVVDSKIWYEARHWSVFAEAAHVRDAGALVSGGSRYSMVEEKAISKGNDNQ